MPGLLPVTAMAPGAMKRVVNPVAWRSFSVGTAATIARIALLATALGNRRRGSVPSSQHRLLGEDSRHCALRRCLGYRGQEGRGEIARGVDTGPAGLAALVNLKGDAGGRLDRGEAQ